MKVEDLINSNSLTNIEVIDGQTVVFIEIAMTAVNMARLEAKQSPWISVEDRLPQSDDDLYIVLDTKMNPSGCGVCDFDTKTKVWIDNSYNIVTPTHWMSIPKLD